MKGVVFFCLSKIVRAKARVNTKEVDVILDSEASIPIVNKSLVDGIKILKTRKFKCLIGETSPQG